MMLKSKYKFSLFATITIFICGCEKDNKLEDIAKTDFESDKQDQPVSESSHFDQLKELDWLVGSWIDKDENLELQITYEWDKNKNFLIQHFSLKISGEKELDGLQMIGWDPTAKKIRSWVFDSDGGFGESVWLKQDNSWSSRMNFTLADGRKASSIHIYTKIGKDAYTFASESRDVDGKLLPNIGPFKIVRKS
jgi:hypothetical protein